MHWRRACCQRRLAARIGSFDNIRQWFNQPLEANARGVAAARRSVKTGRRQRQCTSGQHAIGLNFSPAEKVGSDQGH